MTPTHRALFCLALLALSGCSTYSADALTAGTEFEALVPWDGKGGAHRILLAPVIDDRGPPREAELRGAMRLDAPALGRELRQALGRIFTDGAAPTVVLADSSTPPADQAWRDGYDLILEPHIKRWDATFLETNGWWYPNALFLAWYFWPIGPHWILADEVYGVDCELELELLSASSERRLPLKDAQRKVVLRSTSPDDELELGPLEPLPPPWLALDDLDRGLDLFGTWVPGDLDEDQWAQVGSLIEPYARRHTAVRAAAAMADAVSRFDGLTPREKEGVLSATHGVVIGVSAYGTECPAADTDAETFHRLLTGALSDQGPDGAERPNGRDERARRWAPPKNIHKLVNAQATGEAITDALEQIGARAQPQDRLVFYFAGRGVWLGKGKGLGLVPYGGEAQPLSLLALSKAMRKIPARRRLIVLDADFQSGQRGFGERRAAPRGLAVWLQRAFLEGTNGGAVILAGSLGTSEEVQAYEGQGLLTQYLVSGLRGAADAGEDGLTYADLADYLDRHVVNLSEVALERPQRPQVLSLSPSDLVR